MKKVNISLNALEPALVKIENLSKIQRLLIYGVTLILLIGGFVYFGFMPKFQAIKELKSQKDSLEQQLMVARRKAAQLEQKRAELADAREAFLEAAQALPDTEEIPTLLASISASGQEAGLEFLLFQPGAEVVQGFYAEIPVAINVRGRFHNVGVFFDKVANLSRIVNIRDITMSPEGESGNLLTSCTAVTYKFVEAEPQQ
jgi:type IV pilus assembly protein PilO